MYMRVMTGIAWTKYLRRAQAPAFLHEIRYIRMCATHALAIDDVDVDRNTVIVTRTLSVFATRQF